MALGDFSPSNMAKLILRLDDAMTDSRVQQHYNTMPPLDTIELIKKIETANWNAVRPKERYCEEFDVAWLEASENKATVLTGQTHMHRPPCTIEGEELQSAKKPYKLGKLSKFTVEINDEDCGNMFDAESKVQFALLEAQKKVLSGVAEAIPAYLDAFSGDNRLNEAGYDGQSWNIGEEVGTGTEIATENLSLEKSVFYLQRMFQINRFNNPGIIDSTLFDFNAWMAIIQSNTGAGDTGMMNAWRRISERYENAFENMVEAGYMNTAFVIDQGNLALPMVSFFPRLGEDNEVVANKYIYSLPASGFSVNGQPVFIDHTYTKAESQIGATGRCSVIHTFDLELKFDLWQAPKRTADDVTGVIKMTRGETV